MANEKVIEQAAKKPVRSWTAEGRELWLNGRCHTLFADHAEACAAMRALNAEAAK